MYHVYVALKSMTILKVIPAPPPKKPQSIFSKSLRNYTALLHLGKDSDMYHLITAL